MSALKEDLLRTGMELRETHISWVFLSDTDVWKIKKPVALSFLDFSTVEKRRLACEAEVRLNRRLSSGVYLGVVPVVLDEEGRHRFGTPGGGEGAPVDWAVHMKRLPDEHRADHRLAAGRLTAADLDRIAERLARFHHECGVTREAARYGSVDQVRFNVEENFEQTKDTIADYLDRGQVVELQGWQRRFLEERAPLFEERIRAGRVRDGHGDLRLEHVYLSERGEIQVLDCIEFNERFRFADVCADVVFLAMDLAWRGHADLAERFLASYARESDDFDLYSVADFYESYRAFVRGKIASMVAEDPAMSADARGRAREEARRYYLLALASERRPLEPPMVIAVGGVIASGKSTVAREVGAAIGAPVIESDRTRKFLVGVEKTQPLRDPAWAGSYSGELTSKVYEELFRRAGAVLGSGRAVVLDASFRSSAHRLQAKALAAEHHVPFLFVECRAPAELCRERLRAREERASVSDGRLEIFEEFVRRWEPVLELQPAEHAVVDTARAIEKTLADVLEARAVSLSRREN